MWCAFTKQETALDVVRWGATDELAICFVPMFVVSRCVKFLNNQNNEYLFNATAERGGSWLITWDKSITPILGDNKQKFSFLPFYVCKEHISSPLP